MKKTTIEGADRDNLAFLKRTFEFYQKIGKLSDEEFKDLFNKINDKHTQQFLLASRKWAMNGWSAKYQAEIDRLKSSNHTT